jgi:1-deoxy-D-xylulose-5-phosphate reductoisomerase
MKQGGNMPCVLNAANEIAVDAFLTDKIKFLEMSAVIEKCLAKTSLIQKPTYQQYIECDMETRKLAATFIK